MPFDQSGQPGVQTVGERIRAARHAKRYTQSKLAGTDFSVSYISAIERGQIQPSLRALEIIARHLDLSSVELLHTASTRDEEKPSAQDQLSGNALQAYRLLEAHLLIMQDQSAHAVTYLERLAGQSLEPYLQVQLYYLLGLAFLSLSRLHKSETALQKAERLATKQNDTSVLVRIYNLFGAIYAAMHQYEQAIQSHRHGLDLLQNIEPTDPFLLCEIYNALGLNYLQLNNVDASVTMFKQALDIAEKLAQTDYTATAYGTMSQYYANQEQYYVALLYGLKCQYLYKQQVDSTSHAELYLQLGRAMNQEKRDDLHGELEAALVRYNDGEHPLVEASITISLAEWQRIHGALPEAEQLAEHAAMLVQHLDASFITATVSLVRGRIHYDRSRHADGDGQFVAGLELLERLNIYDELNDEALGYARILEEKGKPTEALKYYKLAFQSQSKMGRYQGADV
jgi:tetratricopeptide (TPR) repeat protein